MLIDQDETHSYHLPASGRPGLIRVAKATGKAELMRAKRSQFSTTVPSRAAPRAAGSWADTLAARDAGAPNASDDYAELPPSQWPVPVMKPWRPPAPTMHSGDYAPLPPEPDWTKPNPAATKRTAPVVDDGFMPCPPSPWDR